MRAPVAVAALIDHERPRRNVDLVHAQRIDHPGVVQRRRHAAFGGKADVHGARAGRGAVQRQHPRLGADHAAGVEHRRAVRPDQRALPHDHQRLHVLRQRRAQRRAARAEAGVRIGEVRRLADHRDLGAVRPRLAQPRVQHRRLAARVGPHQQDRARRINIPDTRRADIARAVADRQRGAVGAALHLAAKRLGQLLEREHRLDRRQIARQRRQPGALDRRSAGGERLRPARRAQLAVLAHIGAVEPLALEAVDDLAGLVADPLLVDVVMVARQDAHHFAPARIDADVAAQRVHHVDALDLAQLPRPRGEGVGLVGQRADRAQIDDVALHLGFEDFPEVAGDLAVLAASGLAHLGHARDLGDEAHAAGAGDAARHVGADQRPELQILRRALGFAVAGEIHAVSHRLVLQVALAALIADRAVERVVDEQELHHPLARLLDHRRLGLDLRRLAVAARAHVLDLHGAGGGGLGRAADHLDQTHAAVAGDAEPLVIAEARDLDARHLAGLQQREVGIDLDHHAVDGDGTQIAHAFSSSFSSRALRSATVSLSRSSRWPVVS